MSENTESVDQADTETDEGHVAPDYSLLRVWSSVLSNIETVAEAPVPIGVAGSIVSSWPKISFQETAQYHEIYHALLTDVREILHETIAEHPGAIDFEGDDDREENHEVYKGLVVDWNVYFDQLEGAWRAEAADSHIQYAALVDARAFVFSRNGFAGHLEARGLTFDTAEIVLEIGRAREERGE